MGENKEKKKYYVVREGKEKGIFDSWEKCKKVVIGVKGAKFKAYNTLEDAVNAFENGAEAAVSKIKVEDILSEIPKGDKAIVVDASCMGNPGKMEYRGLILKDMKEIFRKEFEIGTNNIGEYLAIIEALKWIKENNMFEKIEVIYSDSKIAINWIKKMQFRSLFDFELNKKLEQYVIKMRTWLQENMEVLGEIEILHWNTEKRGEIPADFGRK